MIEWFSNLKCNDFEKNGKHLFCLAFWVFTADFGFSAWGQIFPEVPVTKVRVSAPAPYKDP